MKRLIALFLLYGILILLYYVMVGSPMYDCVIWNQITSGFILGIHIVFIFVSIWMTRSEYEDVNQRFMARMVTSLLYLGLLYLFLTNQFFILQCV